MELQIKESTQAKIVELEGRFDAHTVPPVRDWFKQTAAISAAPNIVVNLKNVDFLDSSALATLVQGMKQCREAGGDLVICHLQQAVQIIFELTRIDKAIAIYKTEEHALNSFGVPV